MTKYYKPGIRRDKNTKDVTVGLSGSKSPGEEGTVRICFSYPDPKKGDDSLTVSGSLEMSLSEAETWANNILRMVGNVRDMK